MKRFYCVKITIRDGEFEYRDLTFTSSTEELKPDSLRTLSEYRAYSLRILSEYTGCTDLSYDTDEQGWVSLSSLSCRIFDVYSIQEVTPEHIDILSQYVDMPVDVLVDRQDQELEKRI